MKKLLALILAMALVLSPALGAEGGAAEAIPGRAFSDVAADVWYAPYVAVCMEAGLMNGVGDGRFAPEGTVTTGEVDLVAGRLEALAQAQWPEFADWSYSRPHTPYPPEREASRTYLAEVLREAGRPYLTLALNAFEAPGEDWPWAAESLYAFGVLRGVDTSGRFEGRRTLTRAELAAVTARIVRSDLRIVDAPPARAADALTSIYVGHSSFGYADPEYLIDLEHALFYAYSAPVPFQDRRDPTAENQGYQSAVPLSGEGLARLRESGALEPLTRWGAVYVNADVLDGHQWGIRLTYSDGSTWDISGSNAYPEGWDALYDALLTLTGQPVLDVRSDWIDKQING